ncbi:hypothetical protein NIIDNTM18_46050 [Mycolicibacterium litorale]|uniref:Uncharacterized protein n=1 Tax=Mycolicibacterium litorale TaxID=758802 RepID=A0A6S6PCH4_9MYCO|nr:hypothetical protein NIIDNTM18_46050 [Mycolicibacterium litorale]
MDMLTAAVTVTAVASFIALSAWYFRRIRAGRADTYVNPSWPTVMRPSPTDSHVSQHDDKQTSRYDDGSGNIR